MQEIRLAVDIVVFTVSNGILKVLLIRRKNPPFRGQFALPGGFVEENESLEEAALRELQEETNVGGIFIKQLAAYGDVKRDPRGRVVSVAYIALVDLEKFRLESREDALSAQWVNVGNVGKLAFDHSKILKDALEELKFEIQTTNIAAQILPEKFALADLQSLYENIMGEKLDKRNFRKWIKSFDILQETKETRMIGAHRPAQLFRFKTRDYRTLKDNVHIFL